MARLKEKQGLPGLLRNRGGSGASLPLQAWLTALILLVFLPTFGVIAVSLMHAGSSVREASGKHLLETAHVVAQSVTSELQATSRLLYGYAAQGRRGDADGATLGGQLHLAFVAEGTSAVSTQGPELSSRLASLAASSAASGRFAVSDLFPSDEDGSPRIAIAVPGTRQARGTQVTLLVAAPNVLIQSLRRDGEAEPLEDADGPGVLAVTDGTGHIISRSRDAEMFIGRPVPDWAQLEALGTDSGLFEARTLEGPEVIFAFQKIAGTPGWVAVVGEPLAVFQSRWRQPLRTMIGASALTILLALMLSLLLVRRILRPIEGLVAHARLVAVGGNPDQPPAADTSRFRVAEFETLRQSLSEAEAALRSSVLAEHAAAQSLLISERRYRTIASVGASAFWARDRSGTVTEASGLAAIAGIADQDVMGEGWQMKVHPDDRPLLDQAWEAALATHSPLDVEFRLRAGDNQWRWLRSRGAPVPAEDGGFDGWVGVIEDVTSRKAVEQELHLERDRLALATQVSGLGIWDYVIDADELYCDAQWYRILGLDPSTRLKSIADFRPYIHPEDVERATEMHMPTLSEMLARHQDYNIVFRVVRPGGEVRWVRSAACLIEGKPGVPQRAVGVILDVTEAHLAEQELQRSYASLRRAERIARIGSWTFDLATAKFHTSDMLYEMNGADPKGPPLSLNDLQRMLERDTYKKIAAAIERCIATGEPYEVDGFHYRPDGSIFAAHIRGEAQRDAEGRVFALAGTVQDLSEREEARARLEALADNLPSGALYRLEQRSESGLTLTYISAGIERLIGIAPDEILADRTAFLSTIHPADRPAYERAVEKSFAACSVFDQEFRARTRDGRSIWMHCRSAPRVLPDGMMVWDGIMRDITAEKEAAEILRRAKDEAEKAERAKSDFLATMSHEIRTPMNTIIGMTRLVLRTELLPKQRDYLEKVSRSAQALLGIINDVLDFSKVEAGELTLENAVFDLEAVLEAVSTVTAMRAEEKGLEIAYRIASDVPRSLRGDSLRLGQVLTNLVSNAVKFTETGEVVVTISTIPPENGAAMLQFTVRDTGIGLTAEQIAGLFRPFAQGGTDTARRYGGTGLGLAICHRLVTMMGGHIRVVSEPGRGSTFSFTVAIGPATAGLLPWTRPSAPSRQVPGRRALIVDDNASARDILGSMLSGFGMEVETVAAGAECLPTLLDAVEQGRPFDIVLMDWRMPGMDGLEAARLVRGEARLKQMPALLMVTAYGREEVLRGVEALGLQGLLIKPVTESTMFNTVSEILNQSDLTRLSTEPVREAMPPGRTLQQDPLPASLTGRRVLVVDDNQLNREVACDFLLAAGMWVEAAVDGLDALDHLARQEYDAVLMDIHMPRMGGLEAVRAIRAQARWAGLPVIALTAQARGEDRQASLDAGMTAHLSKPIDEMALYRTLATVFAASAADPAPAEGAAAEQEAPTLPADGDAGARRSFDRHMAAALRRLGAQPDRVRRLLDGFLRDFGDGCRLAEQYLRDGDAEALGSLAHTVKGSAAYLDAADFCEAAEQLEIAARQGDATLMTAYVPVFCQGLEELLAAVRAGLATLQEEGAQPAQPVDLIETIDAALRLVTSGDHETQGLLERIVAGLERRPERELAERAMADFGDLELASAKALLLELRSLIAERTVERP